MTKQTLLKVLAVTAFAGTTLGTCTDLPPLPSPLITHAMRAPVATHVPMSRVG